MQSFRRRRGRIVGTLEPVEAGLIADLVDQVRSMLAARRAEAPVDPLTELTGIRTAPAQAPDDPALARLLPDFHQQDGALASVLRQIHEPDLIATKDAAAVTLLDTLPLGGGSVRLTDEAAAAWLTTLNDVRLALSVRLGITDEEEEPDLRQPELNGAGGAMYQAYAWLGAVQDSLVTALMSGRGA